MTQKTTDRSTIIYLMLSTLAESQAGEAPESFLYLPLTQALGIHLDQFQRIAQIAVNIGWLERKPGPILRITDDGRKLVQDVDSSLKVQP